MACHTPSPNPAQLSEWYLCISVRGVAVEEIAGIDRWRPDQPIGGERAVVNGFAADGLVEIIEPADIASGGCRWRRSALLAVLVLTRGNVLDGLDRETGVVAIIGCIPVPIAPCADRGQSGAPPFQSQ